MSDPGTHDWTSTLESALRERGLRLTTQRLAIAKTFFASSDHLNADELYSTVRVDYPAIGQATVYRTLRLLEEIGLASSSTFGTTSARFEANDGHHHDHLVCTGCGRIVEFVNEEIESIQEQVARNHDFDLKSHRMELYGVGPCCKKTLT